jgi:hypothetical protein
MLLVRPRNRQDSSENEVEESKYGHPGYAIPRQPIRVVLARDEEAAGIQSEAVKSGPPAYGVWRESVVSSSLVKPSQPLLWILYTYSFSQNSAWILIACIGNELDRRHTRLRHRCHR